MGSLSIVCIEAGVFIIAERGPLIFAPRATLRFYNRWILSTNIRFQVFGFAIATFGMALLFSDFGKGLLAGLLRTFGWFMETVLSYFWRC